LTAALWATAGLAAAFAVGWALGFSRGTHATAKQLGELEQKYRELNAQAKSLSAALVAARRAPISASDSVTILRDVLADESDPG